MGSNRIVSAFVVSALVALTLLPVAARADSVWDADDEGHRADLKWVGVYAQNDGRIRVTVAFHDRLRARWFGHRGLGHVVVEFGLRPGDYYFYAGFRHTRNGLRAKLCESGSGCNRSVRVRRVGRSAIRARLKPLYGQPHLGWAFRAVTFRNDGTRIDKTRAGTIT